MAENLNLDARDQSELSRYIKMCELTKKNLASTNEALGECIKREDGFSGSDLIVAGVAGLIFGALTGVAFGRR